MKSLVKRNVVHTNGAVNRSTRTRGRVERVTNAVWRLSKCFRVFRAWNGSVNSRRSILLLGEPRESPAKCFFVNLARFSFIPRWFIRKFRDEIRVMAERGDLRARRRWETGLKTFFTLFPRVLMSLKNACLLLFNASICGFFFYEWFRMFLG